MAAEKTEIVVKANSLVEASYRMSLIEQQLVLYAICRAREEEKGFIGTDPVRIEAKAFAKQFNIDPSNVYGMLKAAASALMSRKVTIAGGPDDVTGFPTVIQTLWVSHAVHVPKAGVVKIAFSKPVIPFLVRLEGEFTKYRLDHVGRMTSAHAVRIYELLVQFKDFGKREISLIELKKMLAIESEYPRIFDLKKYVLEPSMKQINECTDLTVSYDQRKAGRTVTHLIFKIQTKPGMNQPKVPSAIPDSGLSVRAYIEKHALPGESYDTAFRRLKSLPGSFRDRVTKGI